MRLSPVTRRRFAIFRQNRRGYCSSIIFLVLFVLSLFAEFIANDRPLVIHYKGEWLFPVLQDYSEDRFGADFLPTEADYTDPDVQQGDPGAWLDDLAGRSRTPTTPSSRTAQPGALAAHLAEPARAPTTRRATCWRG